MQLVQISLTIITLIFSFMYSKDIWQNFKYKSVMLKFGSGLLLGFLASLLGIGGGPINVTLLMLLFNVPIKYATVYSIITIFFSQLSKILTIMLTEDMGRYDLALLYYIIPAAIIGGFLGSYISGKVSDRKVSQIYRFVIILVLIINIYNGFSVL